MDRSNTSATMINMFPYPVFRVNDGIITEVNLYAKGRFIEEGTAVEQLLPEHYYAYQRFRKGCLSLTLDIQGISAIATVVRTDDGDFFHLRDDHTNAQFRTMSLAAQQLRQPLTDLNLSAEKLIALSRKNADAAAELRRNMLQMQRLLSNMDQVEAYATGRLNHLEIVNIRPIWERLFTRAQELTDAADRTLEYSYPQEDILCPIDKGLLERAFYNLLSNAIKGSPEKGKIKVRVTAAKERLQLTIENTDNGMGQNAENIFFRYMRDTQIEDGRRGMGLGIPLVQFIAAAHGGTLLMDRPRKHGIRFTFTISTKKKPGDILRSPVMEIDRYGGMDRGLVELSDVLPAALYKKK